MNIHSFTFNPFQENTYVVWDDTGECAIIDPGCSDRNEESILRNFIETQNLKPVLLLNTHGHIDHILGNYFVADTYQLGLKIHKEDEPVLKAGEVIASQYGIHYHPSPRPSAYLNEGEKVTFGTSELDVVFTPGHSPGSVCLIHHPNKMVIGGDVLFHNGIGRTDLPGGNYDQLINSIRSKLYILPEDYTVFPGHGPSTEIGFEKRTNPFTR